MALKCQRNPEPVPTPPAPPPPQPSAIEIPIPLPVVLERPSPVPVSLVGIHPLAVPYLPVTKDDKLLLRSHSSVAVSLRARARMLAPDGRISPVDLVLSPTTDRLSSSKIVDLSDGWLLSLVVLATSGAPRRGQCFVQAGILQGGPATTDLSTLLIADYLVAEQALGWPGSLIRSSLEGPGMTALKTIPNPPAGQDWSITVPTNACWRVHSLTVTFFTSATVADRFVHVHYDDGANFLQSIDTVEVQPGSTTRVLHWSVIGADRAGTDATGVQYREISLPPQPLLYPGYRIFSSTHNIQPGDQFVGIHVTVEEWIGV